MWFWSTHISPSFYKKILILIGFCLCIFILWIGVMEYSTRLLKERIHEVEKLLKTHIGFPIQYSSIEPEWHLGSIVLSLKDVVVIDNEVPIPFLSVKTLQLGSNPYRLIFQSEQPFNCLSLDGMKMVMGWDRGKDLTVLGLKGEWFSSSFDYSSLLKALSSQDKIIFHNSDIFWQGPNTSLIQRVDGKLTWDDVESLSWQFSGKQQIKMNYINQNNQKNTSSSNSNANNMNPIIDVNPKGEFWPLTFINLQMNTPAKELKLKARVERTQLEAMIQFPEDSKSPIKIESVIEGHDIDLRVLHQNIILKETDPEWLRWLIVAIERGSLTWGKVNIIGPLDDLNWDGEIDFQNVNLQYNKDWPKIRQATGKVWIEKDKVKVQVLSGNILGSPLKQVEALIEPIGQSVTGPMLQVKGSLNGRLENALKFLLLSPLKKTLGQHLSPLKPSGLMELHLNLKMPLGNSKSGVEVQGQLGVEKGEIILEALELPMTNVTGLFRFTEKGVEAKGVTAELLEKPVQIEASPSRVTATTEVDSDFLKEKFDTVLLSYLKGKTEMSVSYLNEGGWVIESSLQGMAINLPEPFGKKTEELQPIVLTIFPPEGKESYYALDAQGLVSAKWTMETEEGKSRLKRGSVELGGSKEAVWNANNILSVGGEMPYLNLEEWKSFLDKTSNLDTNVDKRLLSDKKTSLDKEPSLDTEQNLNSDKEVSQDKETRSDTGSNTAKALDKETKFSPKLSIQVSVLIAQLEAFGLSFKNTVIKHLSDTPEWGLDGPMVKGRVVLPTSKNNQLQFSFQYLKLSSKQIEIENRTANDLLKSLERVPIVFNAQSLTFDDAWFGETNFRLLPKAYGYEIQDLSLKNKTSRLEGNGEWRMTEGTESSHITGEILSDNMSQTFAQWGFTSAMQEGKGRIQFNLQWPGSPFQVSLKKAVGSADLKLRSGYILGMNPGLGKILGLLSIENVLTRRLQLDFSDVVNKGFAFDKLEANMEFKTGILETNDLFIDGPAAKIKISGIANLTNRELDLQMLVIPKIGNTLPIAATLATGNPGIGFGVWFVDKLTGSRISEVSQKRYHVTGTWDAPQMNELGKRAKGQGRK